MIYMSRFHHRAHLVEVPRSLVDEVVRALLDAVEGAPFADGRLGIGADLVGDVRLVEGEHLTAGARYRVVPPDMEDRKAAIEARLTSWDRAGECRVDVRSEIDGHVINARVELQMAGRRLRSVRVEGDYQGPGPGPLRVLQRAKWEGEARLEEWWSILGQWKAPISLRVHHPLAGAFLLVERGKDKDARWGVESSLRFGGRGIARPLAAVGLLVMRGRVRRLLRDAFGKAGAAWNGAVPGLVERGLKERVTLRHRVEVKTVSREWAEGYVAALHRAVEELRFEKGRLDREAVDIRLLQGAHIRPGARYRIAFADDGAEPLDVTVTAWDFAGSSHIEFSGPDEERTGWAELDSAQKPTIVRGALTGEIEKFKGLDCAGEADLERWWSGVGGSGGDVPAFTVTADHPQGEGVLSIAGSPGMEGWWTVDVAVAVEGRSWARPLIAVAGLIGAALLGDSFQEMVDEAASRWNGLVPAATSAEPREAAETTLRELLDEPAEDMRPD